MKEIDEQALAETLRDIVAAPEFGTAAEDGGKRFGAKGKFPGQVRPIALGFGQLPVTLRERKRAGGAVAARRRRPLMGAAPLAHDQDVFLRATQVAHLV